MDQPLNLPVDTPPAQNNLTTYPLSLPIISASFLWEPKPLFAHENGTLYQLWQRVPGEAQAACLEWRPVPTLSDAIAKFGGTLGK